MGMSEEERAAKYPFLTTVTEAEEEVARRRQQRAQMGLGEDIEFMNKVYVWGLNDRGQLGSDLGEYIVSSARACVLLCMYVGNGTLQPTVLYV